VISSSTKLEYSTEDIIVNIYNFSDNQNDLVYHDYGTAIKMSNKSKLNFSINSHLNNKISDIYAINLEKNTVYKIGDLPDSEGFYKIIGELNNGEFIDLTPKVFVEAERIEKTDNDNGIILLK